MFRWQVLAQCLYKNGKQQQKSGSPFVLICVQLRPALCSLLQQQALCPVLWLLHLSAGLHAAAALLLCSVHLAHHPA
jgi:hypothetical protein